MRLSSNILAAGDAVEMVDYLDCGENSVGFINIEPWLHANYGQKRNNFNIKYFNLI